MKIINYKKWIGLVFGVLSLLFAILIVCLQAEEKYLMVYLLLPILSYKFTMWYSNSKPKDDFNPFFTFFFFTMAVALTIFAVNISRNADYTVSLTILRIHCFLIPFISVSYGIYQLEEKPEDNFLEIEMKKK